MSANTVYITNMSRDHDYTGAAVFGAVCPITTGNYAIFKTTRLVEEVVRVLMHSKETDYLLLSGSSVIAGISLSVWLMLHKKAQLLLHDRRQGRYVPRTFDREATIVEIERQRDRIERDEASRGVVRPTSE